MKNLGSLVLALLASCALAVPQTDEGSPAKRGDDGVHALSEGLAQLLGKRGEDGFLGKRGDGEVHPLSGELSDLLKTRKLHDERSVSSESAQDSSQSNSNSNEGLNQDSWKQLGTNETCVNYLAKLRTWINERKAALVVREEQMRHCLNVSDEACIAEVKAQVEHYEVEIQLLMYIFNEEEASCNMLQQDLQAIDAQNAANNVGLPVGDILPETDNSTTQQPYTRTLVEKRSACHALPKTNDFVSRVHVLKINVKNDKDCVTRVKNNVRSVKTKIKAFHDTTVIAGLVKGILDGTYATLSVLSRLPYVGTLASTFNQVVARGRSSVGAGYSRMKKVDKRLYPTWYKRLGKVETSCKKAIKALKTTEKYAETVYKVSSQSRDCICNMYTSSNAYRVSRPAAESTSNRLVRIPKTLNQAVGRVGDVCAKYDNLLSTFELKVPSTTLNGIYKLLNKFYKALGPIGKLFLEIKKLLTLKKCIPNPVELVKEGAERTKEWTRERAKEVARAARRAAEKVAEGFKKIPWRRRRSAVFIGKETATDFIGTRESRLRRASNICFSIQDILNGLGKAFSALLGWAERLLGQVMSKIPGLNSLPGLPKFDVDFNLLDRLNWPNVDIGGIEFRLPDMYFNFLDLDLPSLSFNIDLPRMGVRLPNIPNLKWSGFNIDAWRVPYFRLPSASCRNLVRKRSADDFRALVGM